MTKKRSSEIFTLKMEIFPEIGPRKIFLVPPQIRRQVSAHGQTVRSSRWCEVSALGHVTPALHLKVDGLMFIIIIIVDYVTRVIIEE